MRNPVIRRTALALATALALSPAAYAKNEVVNGAIVHTVSGVEKAGTTYQGFIVKYKEGTAAFSNPTAAMHAAAAAQGRSLRHSRRLAIGADLLEADAPLSAAQADALMRSLASTATVDYVEANMYVHAMMTPNDTRYGEQWHYFEATGGLNVTGAWDRANGSGVVVAVIDTGITSHSDLAANVLPGYDFISDAANANDGNGRDSDASDTGDADGGYPSSWHGTHVAGTIAAVTNNAKGVAGVAFNAKILPVRVLGKQGGTTADIADAIVWASGGSVSGAPANANPAEVINMSLGGGSACSSAYQNAINTAVANGTTVVVAAGNSNSDVANFTPASCNNVIAVASNDRQGNRASYSNYGAKIDVTAPGGETATQANGILSTLNSGQTSPGSESYAFYQGTSMAAPHVAGVVALIQSVATKTPAEVETILKTTVRPVPGSCTGGCGAGIVDALAAVNSALGGGTNPPPVASFTFSTSGLSATFTDGSTDSNGTVVSRSWNFGDGTTSTAANPTKTYAAAGTYTVTLTVTDNGGATNTTTRSVTVGSTSSNQLTNGVPVTGLSGAAGSQKAYTINVPSGATNLVIATTNTTGDADLYVKFGSAPTTSSYDCRPYSGSGNETCTFAAPSAGTYHIMINGYASYSGMTLTGSYTTGGGTQPSFFQNTADYAITDNATVDSPITVSGRTGNAPSTLKAAVNILHTYKGDLKVDVVAPDGTLYNIHNRTGSSTDNVIGTFTINASSEVANGVWKLRVNDNAAGDVGKIDSWSLQF